MFTAVDAGRFLSVESASTALPDDELAAFLAALPPRRVPARLAKSAQAQAAGWFLLVVGAIFGVIGLILADSGAALAPGQIVAAESTKVRINGERVWNYRFEFRAGEMARLKTCFAAEGKWRVGSAVEVRYLPGNPDIAVVQGGRCSLGGAFGSLVLIFPFVGFGLLGWTLTKRGQAMRILEGGRLAEALVESVEPTSMKVNKRPVYAIKLRVTEADPAVPITVRFWEPDVVSFAKTRMASRQPAYILFDPTRPNRVLLPETL